MNHMDIKRRILQSLRPRKDGVLLRAEIRHVGSASQVSVALNSLASEGLIAKLERGIFAKPSALEQMGKAALMNEALSRIARQRASAAKQVRRHRSDPTAIYVRRLARREGIAFAPTFADQWAQAVTKLAGDDIKSDKTDDLLVALTRAGKLSPRDMTKLVIAHHRNLAGV
jgi:hypothetical protein